MPRQLVGVLSQQPTLIWLRLLEFFGIVIGTAADTALDIAVHIVLIHGLRPSFIVDGLSMACTKMFMQKNQSFFSSSSSSSLDST